MNSLATQRTDDKLDELLLIWEEVYDEGQNLPAEELCADCPELAEELQRRISVLLNMEDRFGATGAMDSSQSSEPPRELKGSVALSTAYTVLRQHATGGLGEVYLAHDSTLQREVAVKTLKDICQQMPDRVARFLREARITGQLEHPGIVPVYGLGTSDDGKPLYAMRFIRGESLDEAIQDAHAQGGRQGDLRRLLRHLVSACRTVHYAHSRRVLHCDLKPLNIMVGKFGETFVLDWGEAVVINPQTLATEGPVPAARGFDELTTDSPAGGTIPYMAPERVDGKDTPLDITSDVYSLGTTLYKILAGRDAFRASTRQELIDRIRRGDYSPPRDLNPHVPPTLSQICAKAMAVKREDRYENAGRLADDIQSWMDDEPVSLRSEGWTEWLSRMSRRHRAAALATLITLVAVVLGTSALAVMSFSNARQRAEDLRTAEAFRVSGLKALTRFAALQIERDIEANWKTLEEAARAENLPELISAVESTQQKSEDLQRLLEQLYLSHREDLKASSWFVVGANGDQLGRFPEGELSFDPIRNFAHKSYFHGEEQEYEEGTKRKPLRQPALSTVFFSSSDEIRKIAYSVPIWKSGDNSQPVGVLVMTVALGDVDLIDIQVDEQGQPETGNDHDHRHALLIDLRADWKDRRGTVLQHPVFREERLDPDQAPLVSDATVVQLDEIRRRTASRGVVPEIAHDFVDPILKESRMAAIAPVRVRGTKIGWFVVVTEPPSPGLAAP